jgi:FimV-like protein
MRSAIGVKLFLAFLMLLVVIPTVQGQSTEDLLQEANHLFDAHNEKDALNLFRQVIKQDPENHEALWKGSFLSSRIGNRLDDDAEKKKYFYNAMKWADKAMAVDSTAVNSYYAMGVALGRMALISPAKERVAGSRKIEKVAEQGLEIDPRHAGLNHVLGFLYYRLANASRIETMAANMLFGGLPANASNERAIQYISRAVENRPDYLLYRYDLARAYHANGEDAKARTQLNKVLEMEGYSPDDPEIKSDARKLLVELS